LSENAARIKDKYISPWKFGRFETVTPEASFIAGK